MKAGDLVMLNERGLDLFEGLRDVYNVNSTTGLLLVIEGGREGLIKIRWLNNGDVDIVPAHVFEVLSSASR